MFVVTASVMFLVLRGLKFYDHVVRKMRIGEFFPKELEKYAQDLEGRDYVYVLIPRARDRKRKLHRLIPSFLLPYKHYCAEEVASSVCNDCGQCTSASDSTIRRWKKWWHENWKEFKSKGHIIADREHKEHTLSDADETTLAYKLKDFLSQTWLGTIMAEFTSEGLWTISHRVQCLCPLQTV